MKTKIKYFILGVLVTLSLISTTIYAESVYNTIEVVFNRINISINGKQVAKQGENYILDNGKEVPFSILYEGTTYLPIRKVSDLLSKNVTWDGETMTAEVNDESFIGESNITGLTNLSKTIIIKIKNKHYSITIDQQLIFYSLYIDSNKNLYSGNLNSVAYIPLVLAATEHYTIKENSNPNIDGIIEFDLESELYECNEWIEYEGVKTITMLERTLYNVEKSKSLTLTFKDFHHIYSNQNGIENLVKINGNEYVNIGQIVNYLGCNYNVYTDTDLNATVIEILK